MSQKNSVIQRICCYIYACNLNIQHVNKTPVFAIKKAIKTSKRKSDDEFEILKRLVKKEQILLNSYFGCSAVLTKQEKQRKHPVERQDY